MDPNDPWGDFGYPIDDLAAWRAEVADDNTRLGYRDWCAHQHEIRQEELDRAPKRIQAEVEAAFERGVKEGIRRHTRQEETGSGYPIGIWAKRGGLVG